jgi:hypothetical protein
MCYFVTIGVPTEHRQPVEALQKGRFRVDPAPNPSVARLFPPDDALFTLTYGGCSCDLYAEPSSATGEEDQAATRARYQRQGWSEAKIARALQSQRRPRTDHRAKFCETISTLVTAIGHIRLFAHSYSGDIDTENVGTAAHVTIGLNDFVQQQGAFQVDTVVELVREARVD